MKTVIQVELKNGENISFKIKIVEIMALLAEADLCSMCLTITNKRQMKGSIGCNQSFHSLQNCMYVMGDKIHQDKNRMYCKLREANYYF
jgi:hypothetical protein